MSHHPPEADFVHLDTFAPTVLQEPRYAGYHNFIGRPVPGYASGRLMLSRAAAAALKMAQQLAHDSGHTLKVYDAYRPQKAVDFFVRWSGDLADQAMKGEFYPELDKQKIFPDGYVARRSGHSRGSTVDLTLVALPVHPGEAYRPGDVLRAGTLPYGERFCDNGIDMGTGFDTFDPLSHTTNDRGNPRVRANRRLLVQLMHAAGFDNYPYEWWHFTLRDEPYPETYFDFDP